jgi:hypothetical protein
MSPRKYWPSLKLLTSALLLFAVVACKPSPSPDPNPKQPPEVPKPQSQLIS